MKISKSLPIAVMAALALLGAAEKASAVVLFTDNFTVDTSVSGNTSYHYDTAGRQGGTLGPLTYTDAIPNAGYEQLGNPTTFTGNSNALLLDYGGGTFINYNFASIPSAISITFDRSVNPSNGGTTDDWLSLQVLGTTAQTNFVTGADFGILFRGNGGTQLFDHGGASVGTSGTNTGYDVFSTYTVVLSDASGTGSAFAGNGSVVKYYEGSTLLGTMTIGQLTGGYIGFGADQIAGIDNLSIQTVVPETSSLALVGLAGGLLAVRRRK